MSADKASKDHGWNDPDMLQVGLGVLTEAEEQTHFALWAFAKAPLIIGADLDTISNESLAILKNQYLIDINQDDYGQQVGCIIGCDDASTGAYHVYAGKFVNQTSKEGSLVALSVNWDDAVNATVALDLVANGFANAVTDKCTTTDLWTGDTNDHYAVPQTFADIAPHGHAAKKIKCLPF
jgi:alpha-galactosidase